MRLEPQTRTLLNISLKMCPVYGVMNLPFATDLPDPDFEECVTWLVTGERVFGDAFHSDSAGNQIARCLT